MDFRAAHPVIGFERHDVFRDPAARATRRHVLFAGGGRARPRFPEGERERFAIRGGRARVRHRQFIIELGRARDRRRHELVGATVGQPLGEAAAHLFVGTRRLLSAQRREGLIGAIDRSQFAGRHDTVVVGAPRREAARSRPHRVRFQSFTDASFRRPACSGREALRLPRIPSCRIRNGSSSRCRRGSRARRASLRRRRLRR